LKGGAAGAAVHFLDGHENRQAVDNFLFSVGNQKKIFQNFNTANHGVTFNYVLEIYFFDTVALLPALNGSKMHPKVVK
jgi:hypothetical protein